MHGREHIVGIMAQDKILMAIILRYADELRMPESYFANLKTEAKSDAVQLAVTLIEDQSGKFEPQKMPNEYANAVHELVQAKIEQRAPEVEIETPKGESPKVINIMDALKKSMQARGQKKVRDAVRKKAKTAPKREASPRSARPRVTPHRSLIGASADKLPAHFAAQVGGVFFAPRFNHHAASAVEDVKLQKPSLGSIRLCQLKASDREFQRNLPNESVDRVLIMFSHAEWQLDGLTIFRTQSKPTRT